MQDTHTEQLFLAFLYLTVERGIYLIMKFNILYVHRIFTNITKIYNIQLEINNLKSLGCHIFEKRVILVTRTEGSPERVDNFEQNTRPRVLSETF